MTINDDKSNKSTTSVIEEMVRKEMKDDTKTWLATYLYYAEPWEEFLTDAVKPFVESVLENNLAEQFFFIRYWERGPHIRLRFKGKKNLLEKELKPEIKSCFSDYFRKYPSRREEPKWATELPKNKRWFANNSIKFIKYEPEFERYGGPVGIVIAESQFEASSQVVLAIIEESKSWDYDRALGAAIQLHLGLTAALNMDLTETRLFYSYVFKSWFSRAYGFNSNSNQEESKLRQENTLKAFEENFVKQESILIPYFKTLWDALENEVEFEQARLNQWQLNMTTVSTKLYNSQKKLALNYPDWFKTDSNLNIAETCPQLWFILTSYVHMTNNRLGIMNHDEAYLGYLIKRGLEILDKEHIYGS